MADFKAHRINVGSSSLPQFQVVITMSNCGVRKEGHVAITNCATVEELDESVKRLVTNLYEAHDTAKAILEENKGEI